jgi:uncharacterized membrane protein
MSFPPNRWLLERLDEWRREGLISESSAQTLRQRYAIKPDEGRKASVMMGGLGSLLIGAGLIAILAHNWDGFSRAVRLLFAFVPLLLAQCLGAAVLWRSVAVESWKREAVAVFQTMTTGACLLLVSQIYHLSGSWTDFLLCWFLLSMPLAWTHRSSAVALFVLAASAVWSIGNMDSGAPWYAGPMIYPVFLLGIPQLWPRWTGSENVSGFMRWSITLGIFFGLLGVLGEATIFQTLASKAFEADRGELMLWLYSFLGAGFCLFPVPPEDRRSPLVFKPQFVLGTVLVITCGLAVTSIGTGKSFLTGAREAASGLLGWIMIALVGVEVILAVCQKRWVVLAIAGTAGLPLGVLTMDALFHFSADGATARLLSNVSSVYLGFFGLSLILLDFFGVPSTPRLGAGLISVLVLLRMGNSHFSLLTKGLFFIAVGIAFLVFNVFIHRRKRLLSSGGGAV